MIQLGGDDDDKRDDLEKRKRWLTAGKRPGGNEGVGEQDVDDAPAVIQGPNIGVNGLVAPSSASTKSGGSSGSGGTDEAAKRSPIAELLYMRWLEGLKIKWPSIL